MSQRKQDSTCTHCNQRPLPPSLGPGRRARRCLACAKAAKADWRRYVTRYAQKHGMEAARTLCASQGVSFPSVAGGAPVQPTADPVDPRRVALALFTCDGDAAAALRTVGVSPDDPTADALVAAARGHEALSTGDATALGRVAYAVLARALVRLETETEQLSVGALAQLVKPLAEVYSTYAGGTVATRIVLDFGDAMEGE